MARVDMCDLDQVQAAANRLSRRFRRVVYIVPSGKGFRIHRQKPDSRMYDYYLCRAFGRDFTGGWVLARVSWNWVLGKESMKVVMAHAV